MRIVPPAPPSEENMEKGIALLYHIIMKEYGWINPEEFKKIPIPTIGVLLEMIEEEMKEAKRGNYGRL